MCLFFDKLTHLVTCVVLAEAEEEEKVSWNYYEIFQLILQAQADSLIKLGFKPVVKVT